MVTFHAGEKDIIRKKALTIEVSLFKRFLNLNLLQVNSFLKRAEELKTVIRKVNKDTNNCLCDCLTTFLYSYLKKNIQTHTRVSINSFIYAYSKYRSFSRVQANVKQPFIVNQIFIINI